MRDWIARVLSFWSEEVGPDRWFESTPELDDATRSRFLPLYEAFAAAPPADAWREPQAALAAILVLDQFPRNMFRGQARAFATDAQACALARNALDMNLDATLPDERKKFLYMPLMHSEALADQERCVRLFRELDEPESLRYAEEHRDIIARFGRFPHRNRALGRDSTDEERRLLDEHPGYGQ
ncbi:MAG TPA: DUF924 family protein [Mesorhizobium sp.]|jgi:uncharacterized protein (DUF924 family)|nr:DUF924 family protein [Mesorhizobium sp.]